MKIFQNVLITWTCAGGGRQSIWGLVYSCFPQKYINKYPFPSTSFQPASLFFLFIYEQPHIVIDFIFDHLVVIQQKRFFSLVQFPGFTENWFLIKILISLPSTNRRLFFKTICWQREIRRVNELRERDFVPETKRVKENKRKRERER